MWLFWGVGIWFREGVLQLKFSLVIYNLVWKVFDLLFENSAKTMTSRAQFFSSPVFQTYNYSFKLAYEAPMKVIVGSVKGF